MTKAQHAIHAAQMRHIWGRYAARRYAEKRGVSRGAYRLACQLEAVMGGSIWCRYRKNL